MLFKKNYILALFLVLPFFLLSQKTSTLDLVFVGDIMGHGPQVKSAEVVKNEQYDYVPCFEFVKPILDKADFAVGNLELTLPGEPPYQGYPQFRAHDDLAVALGYAGFDLLTTANNHSNDAYKKGVLNTLNTLDDYGFYHTGTFRNADEREILYPLLVYKNDFKLAFLNYTYGTNGIPTKPPTVVNLIDEKQIEEDIKMAQKFTPDYIIVMMHWGDEYQLIENKMQRNLTEKIFNWGADMIIGGHPHVIQPIYVKENQGKQKLITYSLGNFISNQKKKNTDGGLLLNVRLEKNFETKETRLVDNEYTLLWRHVESDEKGKKTYRVLPIPTFEKNDHPKLKIPDAELTKMNSFAARMRKHLSKSDSKEKL